MSKVKSNYIDLYNLGCAMMVFSFDNDLTTKNLIIRNFLAKSISQLRTINILNTEGQLLDCYIIYRAMVDRLAHLYYLERTNSYQEFDNWSFLKQMEANNTSLSDVNFKDGLPKELFLPTQEEKDRYHRLLKEGVQWKRPNVKEEFKTKDFYFLYQFGYDYASTHVHPMANDGMIEYFRMVNNPPEKVVDHFNHQTLLIMQNSTLISSMIVTECLNFSSYRWRKLAFNFIESFREAMNDKENEFELNFYKLKKFIDENMPLGEKLN